MSEAGPVITEALGKGLRHGGGQSHIQKGVRMQQAEISMPPLVPGLHLQEERMAVKIATLLETATSHLLGSLQEPGCHGVTEERPTAQGLTLSLPGPPCPALTSTPQGQEQQLTLIWGANE